MNNKRVIGKGLASIGALIGRADLPTEPVKRERVTREGIVLKTFEKIMAAQTNADPKSRNDLVSIYLSAAVREAHSLGHAEAIEQNSQVERLLEKQYDARTKVTMPAVVAGVMEQCGNETMVLDLNLMATVFERNEITYDLDDQANVIAYTLRPIGDAT